MFFIPYIDSLNRQEIYMPQNLNLLYPTPEIDTTSPAGSLSFWLTLDLAVHPISCSIDLGQNFMQCGDVLHECSKAFWERDGEGKTLVFAL